MRRKTSLLSCLALIVAMAAPAAADIDAFEGNIKPGSPQNGATNADGKGRQTFGHPTATLGLDFTVLFSAGITVTQLGIWDDTVVTRDGLVQELSSPHFLGIWNTDTHALLGGIFTAPGTGDLRGDYRYFKLANPIGLDVGANFTISVFYGPGNLDSNGNSGSAVQNREPRPFFNDGGGLIDNIGSSRYGLFGSAGDFPGTPDTDGANRYHAGSFSYNPNPEPGTIFLLAGAGAMAVIVRRRRRRAQAQA